QFQKRGLDVTLVQRSAQIMTHFDGDMAYRAEQVIRANGVHVLKSVTAKQVTAQDGVVSAVELSNQTTIQTDLVLLALGVEPQTQLVD
ncbi:FAD-dependent oxidoreductase, partial [Staphylococcus epidermidis]